MRRYNTLFLLLLLLHGCVLQVVSLGQTILCTPEKEFGEDANQIYSYDCSNQNLTWSIIQNKIFDRMHSARKINLSKNKLDLVIKNLTFEKFEDLKRILNLSSNTIQDIESDGFRFNKGESAYLKITTLDLSHNKFIKFPYDSLATLSFLTNLYLSYNKIQEFQYDDQKALKNLKYLHLNGCNLKYINYEFLNYLQQTSKLEYLNLNDNQIISFDRHHFLSYQPPLFIDIQSNPLNCSCELLWFKKYLLKQKNVKTQKNKDVEFQIINTPDIYDRITCRLDYYQYLTYINETESETTTITQLNDNSLQQLQFFDTPISQLDDRQFLCPIQTLNTSSIMNKTHMRLECQFSSYPEVHVWWLFSERTINIVSGNSEHYTVDETNLKDDSLFYKKSVLFVSHPTEDDRGSYKCCASFNSAAFEFSYKVITTSTATNNFTALQSSQLVDLSTISAQRLNKTIFQTVDVNYNGYILPRGARIYATGSNGFLITDNALNLYLNTNKKAIYIVTGIATFLVLCVIVILFIMLSIRRDKNNSSSLNKSSLSPEKLKVYNDDDYSRNYEEIQQLKLRQHDGFEYGDDNKYNNYKINKNSIRENVYADISRDDDALSSLSSKSGFVDSKEDSIEIEENLNEYEDPSLINLRKPDQITSKNFF